MNPRPIPNEVFLDSKSYTVVDVKDGGMGRVWILAQKFDEPFDPIYRRRLAVKTFDFVQDKAAIEQELNVWISILHPNALPLKKIGRLNYRLAAIMPLMLATLDDELELIGSFGESAVVNVLTQAAEALNYAWLTHKVLHLDIKPSNILVKERDPLLIQIADWGISRMGNDMNGQQRSPIHGVGMQTGEKPTAYLAGTYIYMAPERFSGAWVLSPRADIYSLGMLAIHLLRGTLPFRFGELDPLVEIQSGSYMKNAETILSESSVALRKLILQSIDPTPENRVPTFERLLTELRRLN